MNFKTQFKSINKYEWIALVVIYAILFLNAYITNDSWIALASAFCGITYTFLAGKGNPFCYLIGVSGSIFYIFLSYTNHFWGNLLLYALYYVPMQILGFFKWNKNLKQNQYEIVKTSLSLKENIVYFSVTFFLSVFVILALTRLGDNNPVIDGLTTVFSILGMLLTVKRAAEQWVVWMGVNFLSLVMWLLIAINGSKVYSTVIMWFVYFVLAIYFYIVWMKELRRRNN